MRWTQPAGAVAALLSLALVSAPTAEPAASPPEQVTVRKAVEAEADADGRVRDARLLTELQVRGDGPVDVRDPVGAATPRRLDGWGRPSVRDGEARWRLDVDGTETVRTVADYDADLPVAARLRLRADDEAIDPADLPDATGAATSRLEVRNTTAEQRSLSWQAGEETREERVAVPVPLIARVTATFDQGWRQVAAPAGTVATDAQGTTTVTWVALLFEPFGDLTTEVAASGVVDDAQPPRVTVEAAPVVTEDAEGLREAVTLLREGQVDAGVLAFLLAELGGGIDELGDGLVDLVAGLDGLAGGTGELADGLAQADDGAGELGAGAGELGAGAGQLSGGLRELAGGSGDLADGAAALADGAEELAAGNRQLADGLSRSGGPLGPLAQGAGQLEPAAAGVAEGLEQLAETLATAPQPADLPRDELLATAGALGARFDELTAALASSAEVGDSLNAADAALAELRARLDVVDLPVVDELHGPLDTAEARVGDAARQAAESHRRSAEAARGAADQLAALTALLEPLAALADDASAPVGEVAELAEAARGVADGVTELRAGLDGLVGGSNQAAAAAEQLADGAEQLADGASGVADGAAGVAGGARGSAAGAGDLADGASRLAGGLDGLAARLGQAADGAGELADGAGEAASGADEAARGADALGDGAELGAGAGRDAAGGLARDLALLEAMDGRARDDAVPHGAPADAEVTAAYRLTLAPDAGSGLDPRWPAAAALLALGGLLPGWVSRRA